MTHLPRIVLAAAGTLLLLATGATTLAAEPPPTPPAESPPPPPPPPIAAPNVIQGTPVYTFLAGELLGRFCVAEADKKFAGVFLLLYNSGAAPVTVDPAQVRLLDWGEEKRRWEPVAYNDQLAHPASWLDLAKLLATPDDHVAALLAARAPAAPPPAAPTKKGGSKKSAKAPSPAAAAAKLADTAWTAFTTPAVSEDLQLRAGPIQPGAASFAVVPFRAKLKADNRFRVRLSLSGPEQEVEVQARGAAAASPAP